ncbi:carboxylesterase [Dechloromonas sp. H13]|uniref:alpha/beta hydrolase n=1 Tax=Dechloromonas sp. H13 TaxID=2570193 RepID=UPI001291405E|nr:alpha/beta hydrolase [Dechloromonas sp. H13]
MSKLKKSAKIFLLLIAVAVGTFFAVRIYDSRQMPPLDSWHTYVPSEMSAKAMDAGDWAAYLKTEDALFKAVRSEVSDRISPEAQTPFNRYYPESVIYPPRYAQDWNRSYVMAPAGKPVGAAVLLHGLTDSPYSLRHIARRYAADGFVVIAIRLPGHGTVPAGLSNVRWEDWMAATRLAVREARRLTDPAAPLHLVGFSNGGALAVKYALDAAENDQLARPDRLILLSPMIGITRFARLTGIAGLPAVLPSFAKAAWLSIVPEFNPFKYNSFPVNGGRQSFRLTQALQEQIVRMAGKDGMTTLAPVLTFQSVMDFTVSTRAIIASLYAYLPANGSELVLFDVNRSVEFGPLLRRSAETALARIMPELPQPYRITVVGNERADPMTTFARIVDAGSTTERVQPLAVRYPPEIFSMSHVSIPFPLTDPLYGLHPDTSQEDFGVQLGTLAPRGERGALVVNMDFLSRVASNPFFPFMIERIEEGIRDPRPKVVTVQPSTAYKKVPQPDAAEIEAYLTELVPEAQATP